jgi:hypothetical protein
MKNYISTLFILVISISIISCNGDLVDGVGADYSSSNGNQNNSGNPIPAGVITAGEWNDLNNWTFWDSLMKKTAYKDIAQKWEFNHNNRFSLKVTSNDSLPIINATVKLKREGTNIFSTRTDNKGVAELWLNLFDRNQDIDYQNLTIDVNNNSFQNIKPYIQGVNKGVVPSSYFVNNIQIAFVVDATGSMSDELEYLKTELYDVITRAKNNNLGTIVSTSSVFYRDEGDEYLTRVSNFTDDVNTTINFIKNQRADNGGDFPEAVHSALEKAVNELQWSSNAKAKIMFLLLDAPPHYHPSVIRSLKSSISKACEMGIKIIPITASGIDKDTEFLMRFFAISTNGTYVFITDHSGIGDSHLQPTVGKYDVEYLNNLMVRLINKYAQ